MMSYYLISPQYKEILVILYKAYFQYQVYTWFLQFEMFLQYEMKNATL
jgi:hypothetical protein